MGIETAAMRLVKRWSFAEEESGGVDAAAAVVAQRKERGREGRLESRRGPRRVKRQGFSCKAHSTSARRERAF